MDDMDTSFTDKKNIKLGLFINNQYIIVQKIGVGGFGIVWLAYDFSLRNFVAIKELLPEYSQTKFVEMFYKEALIAKNIIHDNIVRVQHFWHGSNGSYYVVLDYVYGIDLEKLIKKCNDINIKIPWKIATFICMCVLKAIDYANRIARDAITGKSYGIVYRDISPSNVLLSFNGNVKLSDFGIAKTVDEVSDSMPEKLVVGKYPYMSPEQIQGVSDIDHRTDIFSVGVLYYEMLTGQQLYKGSKQEIKEQMLELSIARSDLHQAEKTNASLLGSLFSEKLNHLDKISGNYIHADSDKERIIALKEFKEEIASMRTDEDLFLSLEKDLDRYCDGVMTKLRSQVPSIKGENLKLITLFFAGLPYSTVQLVMNRVSIESLKMARSRFRKEIKAANAPDDALFLNLLEMKGSRSVHQEK